MHTIELKNNSKQKMKVKYIKKIGLPEPKFVKTGEHSFHYEINVQDKNLKKYMKLAKRHGYECLGYDSKYGRSDNYRDVFFKNKSPPYRCRYCNRVLKNEKVTVDHLIPVDSAKKSKFAQKLLYKNGCDSVNDINNLVPACERCNRKKSNKMGVWYIRGKLGTHKLYWIIYYLLRIAVFLLMIAISIIAITSVKYLQNLMRFR